ncbi:hypothetical protein [Dysosmobacter sp. Sow4_B12]|uniref:hypothetical protein n=1 Tax=Dysosmobacter sp. Sow4_B12 TaxID=3438777 RepID=UPI003F938AC2
MAEKPASKTTNNLLQSKEVRVTIHYQENGPSLESCMISILSTHMSKNANF